MTGISGVEERSSHHISRKRKKLEKSNSFVNPFDLSIDITEECSDVGDDSDDEDFEPSLNFTLRHNNAEHLPIEESDESDYGEYEPLDDQEIDLGIGIHRIKKEEEVDLLTSDRPVLVYQRQLMDLSTTHVNSNCTLKDCGEAISMSTEIIASAIYIKWVCTNEHINHRWCSQPLLNMRMHAGDLMLASSILISDNNFQKFSTLAKCLKLPFLSSSTFHRIQRTYLVPSIDRIWMQQQEDVLSEFQDKDLIVLGDGRMDSPGHSAQYCSYTFMEYHSKKILFIVTLDKRNTDRKSTNMEKACFQKGMQFFREKHVRVVEVVTDVHNQIAALTKKDYPDIKHSFDVWHGTKNLGKKLTKVGQEKENKELLMWVKDIVNHYWHTAEVGKTVERFLDIWYGVLHHVVDEHEWPVPYADPYEDSSVIGGCQHGPLEENRDTTYLKKGSSAHNSLRSVVMDKYLVNRVHYYLNCRSTAELENFQNLILAYASKRHSYSPPVYRVMNRLAALDHNGHVERPLMTNKDGSSRWQRSYNKKTTRWSVKPVKTDKSYFYVPRLLRAIICMRLQDNEGMNQRVQLEVDDPRRISVHLAPIPPPPTRDIVASHKSRFENQDKTIDYIIP